MFPGFFRSLGWLRALNVVGVALSLSSLVGVVFGCVLAEGEGFERTATAVIAGTLPLAVVWATLLRWRLLIRRPALTIVVSAVLALVVDATVAMLRHTIWFGWGSRSFGSHLVFAMQHDLFLWAPALLGSWLGFALPVRRAQEMAQQGLAGEEMGERTVGQAVVGLSALALGLFVILPRVPQRVWRPLNGVVVEGLMPSLAVAGLLAGALTTLLAWRREQRRAMFVRSVEQHEVPGYRIDETPAGKVLVRVATASHDSYRVADADEELFALDAQGLAVGKRRSDARG